MQKFLLLFLIVWAGSGCAKVAHMQKLLTIQAYSQAQDRQEEFVQDHNGCFARLMKVVRADEVDGYQTREQIEREFGPPVFKRRAMIDETEAEEWLYREATAYFEGDRVYFYFNQQGQIIGWEHVSLPAKKQNQT